MNATSSSASAAAAAEAIAIGGNSGRQHQQHQRPHPQQQQRQLKRKRRKRCWIIILSTLVVLYLMTQLSIFGIIAVFNNPDDLLFEENGQQKQKQQQQQQKYHQMISPMMTRQQHNNEFELERQRSQRKIQIHQKQKPEQRHNDTPARQSQSLRHQHSIPLSESKSEQEQYDNNTNNDPDDDDGDGDGDGDDGGALDDTYSQQQQQQLIHIVHTRFMQHQGNLTTLGVARLKQFLTFCLPTMQHQTTQNFLWIIKVDPLLAVEDESSESRRLVFEPLLKAINNAVHPNNDNNNNNIYVVGSNYNYNVEGHGGSWRDGQEGEELLSSSSSSNKTNSTTTSTSSRTITAKAKAKMDVYTGDIQKLRRAYELRESLPVLETRLDADDGLHRRYLERVQTMALKRFVGDHNVDGDGDVDVQDKVDVDAAVDVDGIAYVDANNNNNNSNNEDTMMMNATTIQHENQDPPKPRWLYWCIRTQIQWHSEHDNSNNSTVNAADMNSNSAKTTTTTTTTTKKKKVYHGNPELGYVDAVMNDKFCITPGITVGYNVGLTDTDKEVPRYQHTKLWSELHSKYKLCHLEEDKYAKKKGPCLELMGGEGFSSTNNGKANANANANANGVDETETETETETEAEKEQHESQRLVLHAVRSRTLTSAGMDGVVPSSGVNAKVSSRGNSTTTTTNKNDKIFVTIAPTTGATTTRMEEVLWELLEIDFGIDPAEVRRTQDYLLENRKVIAYENSLGQCTAGHSCKDAAKKRLNKVINSNS